MLHTLEQLVAIEQLAVTTLIVPRDPAGEDLRAIEETHTFLMGGVVEEVVTGATLEWDDTPQVHELIASGTPIRLRQNHPNFETEIFGQSVPIGLVQRTLPALYVTEHRRTDNGWHLTLEADTQPGANVATIQRLDGRAHLPR